MAKKNTEVSANYNVTIKETSKELSAKERIAIKDTSDAIKLDIACEGDSVTFTPIAYAILSVHNEKSDNVDYENYVITDSDNNKYVTGSNSFFSSFKNIWDEMENETEEWALKCYKLDSKNYNGKQFLTCSIV